MPMQADRTGALICCQIGAVTGGCVTAGAAPASRTKRRARMPDGPPAHLLHGLEAGGKVARLSAQFVNLSPFRSTAGGSRPGEDRTADRYVMANRSCRGASSRSSTGRIMDETEALAPARPRYPTAAALRLIRDVLRSEQRPNSIRPDLTSLAGHD